MRNHRNYKFDERRTDEDFEVILYSAYPVFRTFLNARKNLCFYM